MGSGRGLVDTWKGLARKASVVAAVEFEGVGEDVAFDELCLSRRTSPALRALSFRPESRAGMSGGVRFAPVVSSRGEETGSDSAEVFDPAKIFDVPGSAS